MAPFGTAAGAAAGVPAAPPSSFTTCDTCQRLGLHDHPSCEGFLVRRVPTPPSTPGESLQTFTIQQQ